MRSYLRDKKFLLRNILVWLLLYLFIMADEWLGVANVDYSRLLDITGLFLAMIAVFYLHFFICEQFFYRKRWLYLLAALGMFGVFLLAISFSGVQSSPPPLKTEHGGRQLLIYLYMSQYFVILMLLSGFYWSVLYSGRKNKENNRIQLELKQMETEKLLAEKKFLQSQINPHFLYNTLNYFYARALESAPELSDGIMTLSEIMKYSLQKNENGNGLVWLDDEVTHLQNVIHIYQLRFNHKLQIEFSVSGDTRGIRIVPLTLITLLENALKHGDLHDPAAPAQLILICDAGKQKLFFSVQNKKRKGPLDHSTGIGLENTRRRMQWTYGDHFQFETRDEDGFFRASFTVPILRDNEQIPAHLITTPV